MSTRALTVFKEEDGQEIVVMYKHSDGYPEGLGKELADFLTGTKLVNGIKHTKDQRVFNGMSCLAAAVIAHFKEGVGEIYLLRAGTRDFGEEYIYSISGKTNTEPEITITGLYPEETLFSGKASQFDAWLTTYLSQKEE